MTIADLASIKYLFSLSLKHNGIPESIYKELTDTERNMLTIDRKNADEPRYILSDAQRSKLKVVLTGGVFDVIHIGHVLMLREAKTKGDFLVVAIASDSHIHKKGREPIHTQEYRRILVESLKPVDIAISGFENPQSMIELVRPQIIVYGYDQKEFLKPAGVETIKLTKQYEDSKFKTGRILEKLGI
ncbi:adenylyltransferase/cytidyltransferase family protein [Candidatus Micrarchaeota archaeon]|nr:adenylyltransferase/cytidyltransferase family protein [Candidatus Micrarchaeota archaeon]